MSETEAPNLPAEQAPLSPAAQQRKRMDALMTAVEQRSEMLVTLLKETGISFDRFREVLRRAIIKGQDRPETNLLLADAGSVIQACIDACTAGLLPDGKQGALVIYNVNVAQRGEQKRWAKKAQFISMYEGLLATAYASGNFQSIMAHIVYEGDLWDYELGVDPWIKHKPAGRPALPVNDEGKVVGAYKVVAAYAVAKTTNGGVFMEVFEPEDIRKVMAVSRAKSGPAKDWPEQMARKGPLRRLWKFLPRDSRMDRVLELEDDRYDEDLLVPEEKTAPSLKVGFAPAALEAPADEPMDLAMDRVDEEFQTVEAVRVVEETEGRAMAMGDGRFGTADKTPPFDEKVPPPTPIAEFHERLAAAQTWLAIKQALRGLYKAENWDRERWEETVLALAWARKVEIEDRTDFVTDVFAWACWVCGADPDAEAVEGNLRVLQTQADYRKASQETADWIQRLAAGAGAP